MFDHQHCKDVPEPRNPWEEHRSSPMKNHGAGFLHNDAGLSPAICGAFHQWEFQDPKMEVLYHIRPYFVGIFPYIGLI
jgi:hypothetical protein